MSDENKPDIPATKEDLVDAALNFGINLLTTLDLPASVVKNAYKALGRLSSAAVEWPAAYLEGKATEIRARTDARVKIISEGADQIAQQMNVPVGYAQIALNKEMEKIIGERLNLDIICAIAANELKADEPDTSISQEANRSNKEQSDDSTNQDANSGEEKTINDVWLNIFETEARPQSTEEGQLLFGRILAGEIKQPGSYSMLALKKLGELDQNIASLFKNLCSVCIFLEHPVDKVVIDIRVPTLGDSPGMNGLRTYGLPFNKLNTLNEYGLIISDYNSGVDYQVSIMDKDHQVLAPFRHQGQYWALLPLPEREQSEEFRIWGVALSRVGRELFHIVNQDSIPEYTEDLKKYFAKEKLQMIAVSSSGPITVKSTITDTDSTARLGNIARDKMSG